MDACGGVEGRGRRERDGGTGWAKAGGKGTGDGGVSVWDPQKMNTVTGADISNDGHYNFDITITASSTTYMVWIDVDGGTPVVGFEKMQFVASTGGGMAGGDMGGGGMGGGNLLSNWVPADEYICTDGMGFWNQPKTCGSPAVQFLYLNKANSTLVLGSGFALTKNDDKADDGGGSYAFDNSSSAGIRTVTSDQWQDAFYRITRTSTCQTFDVKTRGAQYWPDTGGSLDVFQGMEIDIMPGADQFSNQTGGTSGTGGGGQTGASASKTPTIWAQGSLTNCTENQSSSANKYYCKYTTESHTDSNGNTLTSYQSIIFADDNRGIAMHVEKGKPTDLRQNKDHWGGIPNHFGGSSKRYDSNASISIAGTRAVSYTDLTLPTNREE